MAFRIKNKLKYTSYFQRNLETFQPPLKISNTPSPTSV